MKHRHNPNVIPVSGGFAVVFTRDSGVRLTWIQDLWSRKMKASDVRPTVIFPTLDAAVTETLSVIIPYLLREKDVSEEEIIGW
jgi:hypothetical protein